ncbi:hypothetical protein [Flavobacterium branchiicola]|uniref:Transmembrane protein n=1 Tax=Flavobacterium branchiicola TaxID=1114875 RepID=A0ABV9PBI0_9FLAO|nr:hypothetical protein [Flavobacterium branchiicola]MBS7253883.1 hypothetical protein [Flavobacterium branchiicola]
MASNKKPNKRAMAQNQEDWEKKRPSYIIIAIISLVLGAYYLINVLNDNYIIKPSDLETIENLIVEGKPEFKETKGKHSKKWIEFKCENNTTTFKIASYDYRCIIDKEILNGINSKDTVTVQILKTDLDLVNTDAPCEIHSLIDKNKEYLDISCRNTEDQKDGELGYILCSAITVMTGSVFLFKKKPEFFDHVDPRVPIWIVIIVLFLIFR